jgi:flagellar hook protein FlgE
MFRLPFGFGEGSGFWSDREMTIYSAFSIPTLGMMGQSHSLATIGNNIANVTTGGFKRTDTNFSTLLSQTVDHQSDIGGMKPKDINQITQQGNMVISNRDLDLAINGQGFFILNSDVTGGGQTYYGRDGSFEMASLNDISVAGTPTIDADDVSTPTTITTKDGYLVDKNGYYVQGWTADPITGLFTSTSLSSLRVDPYAFATTGQTTTNGELKLNLPSTDEAGLAQVTTVELVGTVEAGDIYGVTVDGTQVNYTVQASDTSLNTIRNGLIAAINANPTVSALVTASVSPTDNKILVTGANQGISHSITGSWTNVGATDDNQTVSLLAENPVLPDTEYYNIEVFDTNGNPRSVRLDFAKTATNTWNLSATVGLSPVSQVDTITLAGTIEAGDVYNVVVEGITFSHTALAADTLTTVRDSLVSAINSDPSIDVTIAASGLDAMTLTADVAGTAFTSSSSATNASAVAQIDNVTLTGIYAAGDTISVDVDGAGAIAPVVYTVVANDLTADGLGGGGAVTGDSAAAYNNITTKIAAAIVANAPSAAVVTAAASGGGTGVVTLTSATPGTPFTQVTTATTVGTGLATTTTPTANLTTVADNTATNVKTTASVTSADFTTTFISTLNFDEDGTLADDTAQVDTITLGGTIEAGDIYSIDIDGTTISHTVLATDTISTIRDALVANINADGTVAVSAAGNLTNALTLTADTPGTAFTATPTAATRATVAQIDNATLTGSYATGDTVSIDVDGVGAVVYTVVANDLTIDGVGGAPVTGDSAQAYDNISTKVAAAIVGDAATAALVTATAPGGGTGTIALTAVTSGTAFTQVTSSTPIATGVATASTPTANTAPITQVDNATLTGTFAAGDTISVDVDGAGAIAAVVYTVDPNDLTADGVGGGGPVAGNSAAAYNNITAKIAAAINGDTPTAAVVTAAAPGGGGGVVTMTADNSGTPFAQVTSTTFTSASGVTTVTTPTANGAPVAQIDNLTLTSSYAAGDLVSVNVDGIGAVPYTVIPNDLTADGLGGGGPVAGNSAAAYNNITAKIAAAINANAPTAAVVTAAAPGAGGGIVTLTAVNSGTAFTQVSSAARSTNSVATASTPTANVASISDNTAALTNTVANVTAITTVDLDLNFPAAGSYAIGSLEMDLDISGLSQFAGSFQPFSYDNNGYVAAAAYSIKFDTSGQILASFDDSTHRVVYKIPLAQFANANALQEYGGNVYQETAESGSARVVDVAKTGYASFLPNTHELSNVDLAGEFTRMMMTQTAYNSSATVFKTVDEMITAARDLKR